MVTPRGELLAEEKATVDIFERSKGSVVFISTQEQVVDFWTRNVFSVPSGNGSGFIWDEAGHVITNFHVVQGATAARVKPADGRDYRATLVGASPAHGFAVLKIGVGIKPPPPVPLGESHNLKTGQKVFAIGNPFGLDWTLTTGIISALNRSLAGDNRNSIRHLIQTDAAINDSTSQESGLVWLMHPRRNIALTMQDAPHVDVVVHLDVEDEVRVARQRPETQAGQVQLMRIAG